MLTILNYEVIFTLLPDLYLILTADLKIIAANKNYLVFTKTKIEDIVNKNIFEAFQNNPSNQTDTGVRNLQTSLEKVISTKTPHCMTIQRSDIFNPDKNTFEEHHWLLKNVPVLNNANEIVYIIHAVQDITEKITQSTANQVFQKTIEELELFACIISHDLQDPLCTINAYVKLLERYVSNCPESKEYLKIIHESNMKMKNIITTSLHYSSKVAGPFNLKKIDLNQVYTNVLVDANKLIHTVGGNIQCDPLPTVFADETQIGQVFQNLIQNAIKYRSPSRNLSIKIQYSETEKEYVIAFTDNGIGIHPENINKLFIIFNRLGKDNNGSGLGLAISKKVIDRHNGRIWVESKLDVGSIFYFSLPKNTSC